MAKTILDSPLALALAEDLRQNLRKDKRKKNLTEKEKYYLRWCDRLLLVLDEAQKMRTKLTS